MSTENKAMNTDIVEDKKYFFKVEGGEFDETCVEKCLVLNNGVMIGSASCQECIHCKAHDGHKWGCTWIYCEKIEEAIGINNQNKQS